MPPAKPRPRKPLQGERRPQPAPRKTAPRPPSGGHGRWWPLLKWAGIAAIWVVVAAGITLAFFSYDLPDVKGLYSVERRPSVTLLSPQGAVIATVGDLYSEPVKLAQLPRYLPQALLATEDRRFYSHHGVDPLGIGRAMWVNMRAGRAVQGGSTITQQLAKNVFLTPQRSLKRKVQEVLLAVWLENNLTKDQILELYLNRVYFGAGTYGIESASQRYFAKSARQLTLQEAAMLVGMLKAPSRYSPMANLAAAQNRGNRVIANMVEAGYLEADAARTALVKPAVVARSRQTTPNGRYFADWVIESISDYVGRRAEDLEVVVTLDIRLQQAAQRAVETLMTRDSERLNADQAALVALGPDGAVRAMIGGRDYHESEFNRITQARRQPGSAFKPFVFLAGLEVGMTPDTVFEDRPITIGNWTPRNFDPGYAGAITLKDAAARSINTVAVQVSERVGRERVIDMANRLGVGGALKPHPSIALGAFEVTPLEIAGAYVPFSNGGIGVVPYGITEIRTRAGEVLYRHANDTNARVIGEGVLGELNDLLTAVVSYGTGRGAQLDRPVAGKTGTSSDFRDAWFIGYTGDLVAAVWVGNDDNTPMNKVTGGGLPTQIWKSFMQEAVKGQPTRPLSTTGVIAARDSDQRGLWQRIVDQFGNNRPASSAPSSTAPPPSGRPPAMWEGPPADR